MLVGILAGLTTCALWGLTFVAPRAVEPFTTWDLTVARYSIFGLMCIVLMVHPRFRPTGIRSRRLVIGLLLGGAGYIGNFVSAAYAVKLAGAAIPPLIIGTMPVILALIANWRDATIPWRLIAIPLLAITVGVFWVNAATLSQSSPQQREAILLGVTSAVIALIVWVIYGLANAAVMRASDAPDGLRWTGVQGTGAFIGSLFLLPMTSFGSGEPLPPGAAGNFLAWALLMGLAGSWFATWCWVVASRRLPLALAAQLIVGETIFGLAYGFMFENRWPTAAEATGSILQIGGVCVAVVMFARISSPSSRFRPQKTGVSSIPAVEINRTGSR